MSSESEAIVAATSAALNPSPDISGCPDDVAMLAAAAVLRSAAEQVEDVTTYRDLRRWADEIDDRANGRVDEDAPSYPTFSTYGQRQAVLSRLPEVDTGSSPSSVNDV